MSLFGRPTLPDAVSVAGRVLPVIAVRRRGSRAIRLRADPALGAVRISLPMRGGVSEALALLARHHDWLAAAVAGWPLPRPFRAGAMIPFDGDELRIDWADAYPRTPRREAGVLRFGGPESAVAARTLRWLRGQALTDLTAATHEIAGDVGRAVAQVRIGDPRARWGSCASGGRIAYSWRLILAPPSVRRAVVAHEVAHLVHANHGPDFHALLGQLDPTVAASRVWLRRHGAALHWVGRED